MPASVCKLLHVASMASTQQHHCVCGSPACRVGLDLNLPDATKFFHSQSCEHLQAVCHASLVAMQSDLVCWTVAINHAFAQSCVLGAGDEQFRMPLKSLATFLAAAQLLPRSHLKPIMQLNTQVRFHICTSLVEGT